MKTSITSKWSKWSKFLDLFPRKVKQIFLFTYDVVAIGLIYLFAVMLIDGDLSRNYVLNLCLLFCSLSLISGKIFGVYKEVILFSGVQLLNAIVISQTVAVAFVFFVAKFLGLDFPLELYLLLLLLSVSVCAGGRLFAKQMSYFGDRTGRRVLIYGAGNLGIQLLTALKQDLHYEVVAFVDDKNNLHGKTVNGLDVLSPSNIDEIVEKNSIDIIALAMPEISREEMQRVIGKIENLDVAIKTVPDVGAILVANGNSDMLTEIDVELLLGRDSVSPDESLLRANISNKVVLVSGAGGSIGSELCRQIVSRSPAKLILVDHSELALYKIHEELSADMGSEIKPVLGSVCDDSLMQLIIKNECVDSVYHAAAYKHVPLVEANPFAAIYVNVFGTQNLIKASEMAGVSSFTLISTDKAVRPTNIMGASKRLAEIVCQLASKDERFSMRIGMVRFGNVLGSSGSVIPKFREQIIRGGPVTVTHPEITRYFMTIPEASELVLQASSMVSRGEIFLLDMGNPVKISDLAKRLIKLSGWALANDGEKEHNKISIEYSGLRPGEKLYEELLISGEVEESGHRKIKKTNEEHPEQAEFDILLFKLRAVCEEASEESLRDLLLESGIGYNIPKVAMETEVNKPLKKATIETSPESDSKKNNVIESKESNALGSKFRRESFKEMVISRRPHLKLLHKLFLMTRPLTVGVRCVLVNNESKVLLVRHTYVDGWHLPGGGVDAGESVQESVLREVKEETGFTLDDTPSLVAVFHNKEITHRDHVVLFLSEISAKTSMQSTSFEIESSRFFSVEALPKDLDPFSKVLLRSALNLSFDKEVDKPSYS